MKLPTKSLERKLFKSGYQLIYAVDEVGMGCLAGPVVVCGVAIRESFCRKANKNLEGVRDSKLLSQSQREFLSAELLKNKDLIYSVALANPKTIDKLNIYQASRLAMRSAVKKLIQDSGLKINKSGFVNHKSKIMVLVDGNKKIQGLNQEQKAIVGGDRKVFAIACASIIAKVYRDKMMVKYAKKYPGYGFEKHKGYGTKYHQVKLMALGPCEIHRKSFAPVAKLV